MASPTTFTKTGNKSTSSVKLDKTVFAVEVNNHDLLKRAYVAYLSNARTNDARSQTRGEVSGGGRKPWKQKGTGRARFGSIRNPIWRGGGIVFGPTGEENYTKKLPTATKQKAIRQALTTATEAGKVAIIEDVEVKDGKTANAAKLLGKVNAGKRTMIIVDDKKPEIVRSFRNIQGVGIVQARYINVYDVLNADTILISSKALPVISEWLGGKK